MDAQVKAADRLDRRAHLPRDRGQPGTPSQQRLPAVQDDTHFPQTMTPGVLRDPLAYLADRLRRDHRRTAAPTLVGVLIDVTVVTRQVTPAVDLEDELTERQHGLESDQRSD